MNLNIPHHLDSTRDLLTRSLRLRIDESAPAIPTELLDDLEAHFATRQVVIDSAPPKRSRFAALREFCATPAFGAAALIVLILSVAVPALLQGPGMTRPETFRGLAVETDSPARVLLIGGPAQIHATLVGSGDLEADSLMTVASLQDANAISGAKVLVNFEAGRIQSVSAAGEILFTSEIPSDVGQLSLAVARALSRI